MFKVYFKLKNHVINTFKENDNLREKMKKVIYVAFNYNHDTGIASKRLRGVAKYLPTLAPDALARQRLRQGRIGVIPGSDAGGCPGCVGGLGLHL